MAESACSCSVGLCPEGHLPGEGILSPHPSQQGLNYSSSSPSLGKDFNKSGNGFYSLPRCLDTFSGHPWIHELTHVFKWEGIEGGVTCIHP